MFKFIPTALAALSLAMPAPTWAGVGDAFDGAQPTPTTRRDGECYGTENGSKVCWFRIQGQTYSVAVHNPRIDDAPQTFLITCVVACYGGFLRPSQAFVDAFCDESDTLGCLSAALT